MNDFFSSKAPSEFTKTERRIMNYILENPADFIHMSIGEAARRVGTSEPTIPVLPDTADIPILKS